ncbi:MAG TPA: thiamine pyrophosphate-binding protein [Dehalococcoidia bacterium]|nr:thiamine pyrophosphate-binding protein [Dehalococcoidia bacterium]
MTSAVAVSVPAETLHREIKQLGISHVVTVPDTHQRSLLARLFADPEIRTITVATEDEAMGVNAGLHVGGAEPMLVIQQLGLFASVNTLRGLALDMNVPTFIMAGLYGRDVTCSVADNPQRSVHQIVPLLRALAVPQYLMESPDDVWMLRRAFDQSRQTSGPAVVLVGAPTA